MSGLTIWFTGLPGAGKTTTATALGARLDALFERCSVLLDGDDLRSGLSRDLSFSGEDRAEQVRRAGEVALVAARQGLVALVSLVSPAAEARDLVRKRHEEEGVRFLEVFVATPLEVCTARDPKKLYARAKAGDLAKMTGVSDPYEPPSSPDLVIETHEHSTDEIVEQILLLIRG